MNPRRGHKKHGKGKEEAQRQAGRSKDSGVWIRQKERGILSRKKTLVLRGRQRWRQIVLKGVTLTQ